MEEALSAPHRPAAPVAWGRAPTAFTPLTHPAGRTASLRGAVSGSYAHHTATAGTTSRTTARATGAPSGKRPDGRSVVLGTARSSSRPATEAITGADGPRDQERLTGRGALDGMVGVARPRGHRRGFRVLAAGSAAPVRPWNGRLTAPERPGAAPAVRRRFSVPIPYGAFEGNLWALSP